MKTPVTAPLAWVKGIQNVFDPARTPAGCVLEAENVLIDSAGVLTPRSGYDLVTTGGHSLFSHHGRVYGVYNGHIVEFLDTGAKPLFNGIVGKVSWGVLNDEPVFTNSLILGRVSNDEVRLIGVEEPGGLAFAGAPIPGVKLAVSYVDEWGEEGPLSAAIDAHATIYLPTPIEPTVKKIRVYQTKPDGDVLHEVTEVPVGTAVYTPYTQPDYGRAAENQYKSRMPGGNHVRYWRGRLLVARGRTLYFSEPLRYGMYDTSAGRVVFEAPIVFVEAVEGGVYVGLKNIGVRFLAGETPSKWEQKVADTIPPQANASALIPTARMKLELQFRPNWVAVWFTHKGFALGLPTGSVLYPQADLLSGLPLGNGSLHFDGDRLIVLSQ